MNPSYPAVPALLRVLIRKLGSVGYAVAGVCLVFRALRRSRVLASASCVLLLTALLPRVLPIKSMSPWLQTQRGMLLPAGSPPNNNISKNKEQHAMYFILDLGILPDYKDTFAEEINNNGEIICQVYGKAYDYPHTFLWQDGRRTDLGTLGGEICGGDAINDAGQIVGTSDLRGVGTHAFLWENGRMRDLGDFGLRAINGRGQAAGSIDTPLGTRAIVWENGQIRDISRLLPGWDHEVVAYNDSGQFAGNCRAKKKNKPGGGWQSFWFDGVTARKLPSLGGPHYRANAMNNRGEVAGVSDTQPGEYGPAHACVWRDGRAYDLDTQNSDHSAAVGINDRGQVVGSVTNPKDWQHAVLWDRGRMIDLNTQIASGSGWILDSAKSINNKGQIVGDGLLRGKKRAFLLTPCP